MPYLPPPRSVSLVRTLEFDWLKIPCSAVWCSASARTRIKVCTPWNLLFNDVYPLHTFREDNAVHEENVARDQEAAHVAAGGTLKEKNPDDDMRELTKSEKLMEWFNGTWFGQRPFVKSES